MYSDIIKRKFCKRIYTKKTTKRWNQLLVVYSTQTQYTTYEIKENKHNKKR